MASHVEVVSTDLRRAKVKVTPGTYLIDVLNEACDKLHLSSDKYLLKYKQKTIDLTGPFRTSGLSAGAKLELVVKSNSPSVVAIKLEVRGGSSGTPPGSQPATSTSTSTSTSTFTKKLPSSMALWQVLRQFEAENQGLLVTARGAPRKDPRRPLSGFITGSGGQLYHEAPVVSIMGREYTALAELQKTLSQCGVNSGSVLLRVEFRPTERPLHEAMEEISGYFKDVDETPTPKPRQESGQKPNPEPETKPDATVLAEVEVNTNDEDAMNIDTAPTTSTSTARDTPSNTTTSSSAEPEPEPEPSGESSSSSTADPLQPSAVFLAPTSSVPAAVLIEEPDSAYEPSVAQMQQRQQALQARSYNTRLKSDAELAAQEAARAARLAEVRTVTAKVRFPDGTLAQWTADQTSTGAFLYAAVRAVMRAPGEPFRLVLPGPAGSVGGGAIDDDAARSLIAGYRLRGNVLLHLLWREDASPAARREPFLRADVAGRAVKMVVPDVAAAAAVSGDDAAAAAAAAAAGGGGTAVGGKEEQKREGGKGGDGLKLPKWLKLPGKK